MTTHKLIIIGSGPAGYTAAIYAARANMNPLLLEGFLQGVPGGQLMTTTDVENYPGFPEGITGPELMIMLKKQAERFGTKCMMEDVLEVDRSKNPFTIKTKKNTYQAESLIIATGATAKRLDVPGSGEDGFWQKGVTACAVCDGAAPIFRDKDLYVFGGGDSAVEEASFLTKYGRKVYLVHRRDELRASKIMVERAKKHPKIEIVWNSILKEVKGDKIVTHVVLEDAKTGVISEREASGVFFAIGHTPNTSFLGGQLKMHDNGYLVVESGSTKTSIPGVFAAGDVADYTYRQAITAAGTGCMAALDAERWITEKEG